MRKIIIKTRCDNGAVNSSWQEGINTILEEIQGIEIDDPDSEEYTMIIQPGYILTKDTFTIFLYPEYAEEIKKYILPYVRNYGLEIIKN